jgi:hypothetical protein
MFRSFRENPLLGKFFDKDYEFGIDKGKYDQSCRGSIKKMLWKFIENPSIYFWEVCLINFESGIDSIRESNYVVSDETFSSIIIHKDESNFSCSFPQIWQMDKYIHENQESKRFLFLSTIFQDSEKQASHSTMVIIDTHYKKVYLFDSNGGVHPSVDVIFRYYFSQLSVDRYEYISSKELSKGKVLNYNLGLEFDKGCCASWSYLFAIFLSELNVEDPKLLYEQFYEMPEGETTMMIYSFISKNFESIPVPATS